ncbi:16S rRNA (uracil(1498)-N(3))-methyltransferase [Cyanobium gracile]|uniref:Ribosomal RNA small subunit methyltransferase E n=1 Tax=Cyanobium gracile (strain ATCC 27147 / PCC 6307) TaxID=292564 RepID=K9P4G9_CYAGP|nr:16S rRNA (uracil(1498)-N(3))-methyltransferase [Cyanobium gracile]AFY27868.1 RNA methyltransferase, RsmE family [Cyanobium gracile PCC 6307]
MGRELRRLLISPDRIAALAAGGPELARLALEPQERHYLERVLRYRPGDRLALVDGIGGLWTAVLDPERRLQLEQDPGAPLLREAPPGPPLELAMAVPRREADLVWRMATELGADRLQPLLAERGAPGERCPIERWQGIVREATEQCERLWHPVLESPGPAGEWLARPAAGIALLATTRREGLPLCSQRLRELADRVEKGASEADPTAGLRLAIGPEGGWSPQEEERAEAAGWQPVSLGPTILRTATAAVAGLALLADWRALRSASCRPPSP